MSKPSNTTILWETFEILIFHMGDSCSFPFPLPPHYHYALLLLTIKQANGVTAVISLLSWSEATSFTCPLLCEVRSLNTVPRWSSGTVTTMLVQGSSSCTSASLRALDTPSVMQEEKTGSEVTPPRVREVTNILTFWTGNANKGPRGVITQWQINPMIINQMEQVHVWFPVAVYCIGCTWLCSSMQIKTSDM